MSFASGSIVRAREREWVVLPGSGDDVLYVRPLGGSAAEQTAILTDLEPVSEARFAPPGPEDVGDYRSAQLLRDATILGSRNSASAIRCFSRINVEPRSYQLVPLLLALKNPEEAVRLLIADGVGIGKTIEALLIARELWDRGEIARMAVLCPPALADQWHREITGKFQLDAALVLSSTAPRLEREIMGSASLFEKYPVTVVSLDYIKSERRRQEFLRTAPELIIVDEAHTCVPASGRSSSQQRYEVVQSLAEDPGRHMVFATATPHSGNQAAFDTLVGMLSHEISDPGAVSEETVRRRLARHFVQRRREDIRRFLEEDTRFPTREELESTYTLTSAYKSLFDASLSWARKSVGSSQEGSRDRRVRWWSALALLRALGSSPAAAAATLRNRAASAEAQTTAEADEIGRRFVMDLESGEESEVIDTVAGSDPSQEADGEGEEGQSGASESAQAPKSERRKLLELARQAEAVTPKQDAKLQGAAELAARLLKEGFNPIFFCRYIATAEYVGRHFRERFKNATVVTVTGELPPAERETRITGLDPATPRVLVATDCLSEGINLQEFFDAVVHYDLSWNPTRHEQRDGRVDRYGQKRELVRSITFYGSDNPVDGLVLDVLISKHKAIRSELGISIPVPADTSDVLDALLEGLLLRQEWRGARAADQPLLEGFEEELKPERDALHGAWDRAKEREAQKIHSRYAQMTVDTTEVARELEEVRRQAGDRYSVKRLLENTVQLYGGTTSAHDGETLEARVGGLPQRLRFILGAEEEETDGELRISLNGPRRGYTELTRTHRRVRELASYLVDTALEGNSGADGTGAGTGPAGPRRAGAIRTDAVSRRTGLALLRVRFALSRRGRDGRTREELVESTLVRAFGRNGEGSLHWHDEEETRRLLEAVPAGNVPPPLAKKSVEQVRALYGEHEAEVTALVEAEAERLTEGHRAVRAAVSRGTATVSLTPQHPVDLLGLYVLLPAGAPAGGAS
jgi:superfamily II DNA or RNA helicase